MMLSMETTMRTVFTIFAAFWVVVLIVLFVGVGVLQARRERAQAKSHGAHGH